MPKHNPSYRQDQGAGVVVKWSADRLYSDDPSSNTADAYSFFCKLVLEKKENKQKEAAVGPIFSDIIR